MAERDSGKLWRVTLDTNPEDCNLHCIMCEEHSPFSKYIPETLGGGRRRMPKRWLTSIFKQAAEIGVKEIIPSTMGEPLLYEHFPYIVDLCREYNVRMNLTTNGTFPKTGGHTVTEWAEMVAPVTSDVKISWNGATAATAEKIMNGLDFRAALENVKEFIRVRNNHYAATGYYCRVTFQLTFMKNNARELADIVKLAAKLGVDRVKGHHLWTHFPEIENLSMKADAESAARWNEYVDQAFAVCEKCRKPDGEKVILENIASFEANGEKEIPQDYECPFLGRELWISAVGKISPCCAPDRLRQTLGDFGNIQNATLLETLQSDGYKNLVKNYKNFELCKTCNMRRRE